MAQQGEGNPKKKGLSLVTQIIIGLIWGLIIGAVARRGVTSGAEGVMIGMGILAVIVLTMAAVGAIAGSAELLIASGIVGTASALIGVRT